MRSSSAEFSLDAVREAVLSGLPESVRTLVTPDHMGLFGKFGGCYAPEILMPNLIELQAAVKELIGQHDRAFWQQYYSELVHFSGRPSPVTHAKNLSNKLGGAQIFLKREDLNQTGAHKVNNVIGQALLAKHIKKPRIIAETGAGQHGIATATAGARYGLDTTIYMGAVDVKRQRPNVFWMEKLGAKVIPVESGSQTLKDAINEAMRDWSSNIHDTHYLLGTVCGAHPFPQLVAYFQSVIGLEAAAQLGQLGVGCDYVYAVVGGGSNAMGIFQGFLAEPATRCVGVEAAGKGLDSGAHAARLVGGEGKFGIAQGYGTYFLQDEFGQMRHTHSVAAGIDYVGVSPIIADLYEKDRIDMDSATDEESIDAAKLLMVTEGIIPALESSHALAAGIKKAKSLSPDKNILVCVSGRGDKDIFNFAKVFDDENWTNFLRDFIDG